MVEDRTNQYFTGLKKAVAEKYPALKASTVHTRKPPSFPFLYFLQLEATTDGMNLSNDETSMNIGYEARFYSTDSLSEARGMANAARAYMVSKGFRVNFFRPVENKIDSSVFQFIARFTKLEV